LESCLGCNAAVEEGIPLCPNCGAPIDVAQFAELELKLKPHVRQARMALGVATMLFGLCFLLLLSLQAPATTLATAGFGVVLFGACCLTSLRWPLASPLTALSIFSALHIAVIVQGRLWMLFQSSLVLALKIILFVLLVGGVQAGLRIRDIRRQSRASDRPVAFAVAGLTLLVGIVLGVWVNQREAAVYSVDLRGVPAAADTLQE